MESFDSINYDLQWNYPIQWIEESEAIRTTYHYWLWRASLAKLGKPCKNVYQEELRSNISKISDPIKRGEFEKACITVPEGSSFAIKKAIDNRANQMASGVDTYEYQINDPWMVADRDTEDLLAAKCKQDYVMNRLGILSSTFSRDLTWAGVSAVLIKYDPVSDKNKVIRINPKNIWFDTKYSSTGQERFRGYSTMISWRKLKKMLTDDSNEEINLDIKAPEGSIFDEDGKISQTAKVSNRKIRSLNGLDIYVENLNKLATSTQLTGLNQYGEYDHDLRSCYNTNWYRSFASDPKAKTNSMYGGDDVELTVIYDLENKIEFKIINRRYVIAANKNAFKRKIVYNTLDLLSEDGATKSNIRDFCLECPLKFQFEEQENMDKFPHPWAPVFSLLDTHDELCGWRAKRDHVSKILSILRIETNGADAVSLRGVLNIMGVVLDDIQGDISTINFNYSYEPIDSQIAFLENRIQQILHAYDQFDAMQAMGDRASAAESGMAIGAVAQGLSTHQNAIMQLYADIARQCIANRVAYSPNQEFNVVNYGKSSVISIQQMALEAIVNVKPALAKKINEKTIAANALQALGTIGAQGLSKDGVATLMELALMGMVPRKAAETFVRDQGPSQEELALAQQQAQNDAMALQQNQQMYEQNPVDYESENIMQTQSPEEIDAIINGLNEGQGEMDYQGMSEDMELGIGGPEGLDMMSQDGAMTAGNVGGLTPESGSEFANPNAMI